MLEATGTRGPIGNYRSVGLSILWAILTLGIYTFIWVFRTHEEMRRYTGTGLGGVLGFVVYFLVSPVTWFVVPAEIKSMYEQEGRESPVSGWWGLWFLLPVVGNVVWFVRVQGVLNDFWTSKRLAAGKAGERPATPGRAEAEQRLIDLTRLSDEQVGELARRTVPPARELTSYFVCSANPSLIEAFHGVFRVGAPAYGGTAGHYRANLDQLRARQSEAVRASMPFGGTATMGSHSTDMATAADVLDSMARQSPLGSDAFVSFVAVGPDGRAWVREVYDTLLQEAIPQGILPFFMFSTENEEAAQFIRDSLGPA